MNCRGCNRDVLDEAVPFCKTGPNVSSQIWASLGRQSQRNPLRQIACDSCNEIGYNNVVSLVDFLDSTSLRDDDLVRTFQAKLDYARRNPKFGSIAECEASNREAAEVVSYYDTLAALEARERGPTVPGGLYGGKVLHRYKKRGRLYECTNYAGRSKIRGVRASIVCRPARKTKKRSHKRSQKRRSRR